MASISTSSSIHYSPSNTRNDVVSHPKYPVSNFSCQSSLFRSKIPSKLHSLTLKTHSRRPDPFTKSGLRRNPICASSQSFDIVVVGGGVIGLTIARQFLLGSNLSVAVVDKAVPCSGATGAGQGYLWMAHKTPGSDIWELAMRSHKLWRVFAESLRQQGIDPHHHLGWKNTGSLLVGRTSEELDVLKRRVELLSDAGLRAEYLTASDLLSEEPALMIEEDSGAAFLPDDCQLDAHLAVDTILKDNRKFSAEGRYAEFFYDPVTSLLRSGSSGEVIGVRTANNSLYSKAFVVAAGCWSGSLVQDLFRDSDIVLNVPVKPRKGHLLVLKNFRDLQLNHALMEAGYVSHQSRAQISSDLTSEASNHGQNLSISMTATVDSMGNLVLGSSRQFSGFGTEVEESVINSIWERAMVFFPKLREQPLADFIERREVRVGLRPYMPDGKPVIGPVPGLPNVFLATGHEGGGLSMALGTAEMVADMVLGNPGKVNQAPFAVQDRCS